MSHERIQQLLFANDQLESYIQALKTQLMQNGIVPVEINRTNNASGISAHRQLINNARRITQQQVPNQGNQVGVMQQRVVVELQITEQERAPMNPDQLPVYVLGHGNLNNPRPVQPATNRTIGEWTEQHRLRNHGNRTPRVERRSGGYAEAFMQLIRNAVDEVNANVDDDETKFKHLRNQLEKSLQKIEALKVENLKMKKELESFKKQSDDVLNQFNELLAEFELLKMNTIGGQN
uniref:Uncharacterized protein n=1 Tax=Panagrolaimus sp. JU765 TaxID=591449 RepID=A0AC34RDC8_9BILA